MLRKWRLYEKNVFSIPNLRSYEIDKEFFKETPVKGFGLVDFTTMPHWGRSDKGDRYLNERLPMINSESYQPFILLNDYQYVYVEDDSYQVVDVRNND